MACIVIDAIRVTKRRSFPGATGGRDWKEVAQGLKPPVMILVLFAGLNILYNLASNDGTNASILVAVANRYLFAATFIGPLACFIERSVQCIQSSQFTHRSSTRLITVLHAVITLLHVFCMLKMLCCGTTGIAFTLLGWCINKCYKESSRRN